MILYKQFLYILTLELEINKFLYKQLKRRKKDDKQRNRNESEN